MFARRPGRQGRAAAAGRAGPAAGRAVDCERRHGNPPRRGRERERSCQRRKRAGGCRNDRGRRRKRIQAGRRSALGGATMKTQEARSGDPAIRRSGDPAIRRSGDPAIRRSGDPAIRRSGDPAIRRSGDPAIRRSGDPAIRRSGDPAIRRSGDPAIRRSGDPAIRRSGDPAIRRSGDPAIIVRGAPSAVVKLEIARRAGRPPGTAETAVPTLSKVAFVPRAGSTVPNTDPSHCTIERPPFKMPFMVTS